MRKEAGTGGSLKSKARYCTVERAHTSATVGRVVQGAKERGGRWTDGRCGWQPLELCSHVNNKQEKRRALASFDCSPVSSSIPATEVQRYLDTPWPLSPA